MKLLFWLCLAGVLWCYAGYPLVMVLRARLRPRPLERSGITEPPAISVVLAVRDGASYLGRRVENLLAQEYPADRLEVLVVCNGCTDGTEEIATGLSQSDPRVKVLVSAAEQGKAGALNAGVARASGEFVVFADVRQSFSPGTLRALLEPFGDAEVGAVSGRLVIQRGEAAAVEGVRLYWGMETALRLAESRTGSVVGATGAIYAIRRECFESIPARTILDDVWLPMRIAMAGRRVVLEPTAVAEDRSAEDARREYLRKRRTMVGNLQLVRMMPALLSPARNPILARYVSHKLLRLATPFLFLGMLVAAGLVAEPLYRAFFVLELGGYLLGGLGLVRPLPLLSLPSAFVMMHAAIFSALRQFRADAGGVWVPVPTPRTERVSGAALARTAERD
ncbi:MAG TPA: glycosyltransferase family 2 protein [Longimicrobiaceae bacterium]|nr:glycosyltransferase family 2 protein [Longimicrobiaceae bacterium]